MNIKQNFKKTEDLVSYCLKNFEETRGCDRTLMLKVWDMQGFRLPENLIGLFYKVTNPETIRRIRQKIQATGFYRPDPQKLAERSLYSMAHREHWRDNEKKNT